jgi:hypothetical protein
LTAEGDQIDCDRTGRNEHLSCNANGRLSDTLGLEYAFSVSEEDLERSVSVVAIDARRYVQSLKQ